MKKVFSLIAALGLSFIPVRDIGAQDGKAALKQNSAAASELAKVGPGQEHARLAKLVGQWDVELSMGSPGAKQMVQKGSAENQMKVGGRFLETTFRIPGGPMPMEGAYTLGFDRRHSEYSIVAMDSFGTYFVTAKGKPDENQTVIKMAGTDDDPQMAKMGLKKEFVFLYELTSDDAFKVKVLFIDTRTPARKEIEFMTLAFKRKG